MKWPMVFAIAFVLSAVAVSAAWDSPDVWLTFDDAQTQATYAEDVSGNGYDGTFNNATPEATINATGKSYAGKYGEAYLFYEKAPGTGSADDFNILMDTYDPGSGAFAISFWYYPFYTGQSVIDLSLGSGQYNEMFFWSDIDYPETFFCEDLACSAYIGWVGPNITASPYDLVYNSWNHIVTQYNGGDNYTAMEMWVNGEKLSIDPGDSYDSGAFSYNINWSESMLVIGGNKEFNGGAGGYLDEIKIFSEALNQSDVDNLMAAGAYSPPVGVVPPNVTTFDGDTTNFTTGSDNVSYPILEKTAYGKIQWNSPNLNFSGQDFDTYVTMGDDWISVDSANLGTDVNGSANVSIYGSFVNPVIYEDGEVCTTCTGIALDGSGYTFGVTHFSNYSITNSTVLALVSPANASVVTDINGNFTFNITGLNATATCTLYIDGVAKDSVGSVTDGVYDLSNASYLERINYDEGNSAYNHDWKIACDSLNSSTRIFRVQDSAYPYVFTSYWANLGAGIDGHAYTMFYNVSGTQILMNNKDNVDFDCNGYLLDISLIRFVNGCTGSKVHNCLLNGTDVRFEQTGPNEIYDNEWIPSSEAAPIYCTSAQAGYSGIGDKVYNNIIRTGGTTFGSRQTLFYNNTIDIVTGTLSINGYVSSYTGQNYTGNTFYTSGDGQVTIGANDGLTFVENVVNVTTTAAPSNDGTYADNWYASFSPTCENTIPRDLYCDEPYGNDTAPLAGYYYFNQIPLNLSACHVDLDQEWGYYRLNYTPSTLYPGYLQFCVNVTANNVILDCNGWTMDGGGTNDGRGIGIFANDTGVTGCTVYRYGQGGIYSPTATYDSYRNSITYNTIRSTSTFAENSTIMYNDFTPTYGQGMATGDYSEFAYNSLNTNSQVTGQAGAEVHHNNWTGTAYNWAIQTGGTGLSVHDNRFPGLMYEVPLGRGTWANIYNNDIGAWFKETAGGSRDYPADNYANTTQQAGTRIASFGAQIGGNYFRGIFGTFSSAECADDDDDGFCDAGNNGDSLPLTDVPPQIIYPAQSQSFEQLDFNVTVNRSSALFPETDTANYNVWMNGVLQYSGSSASEWVLTASGDGPVEVRVGRLETEVGGVYRNGSVDITIDVLPDVLDAICAALTYPNEANQPEHAKIPVNFTIYAPLGFTSPTINIDLTYGGDTYSNESCAYSVIGPKNRTYTCNVSMNYWYAPGDYDLNISITDLGNYSSVEYAAECEYGSLLAGVRTQDAVEFPDAGPGISNSLGEPAINVLNTGNVPFDISITAYDLLGRTSPSNKLAASAFKAGASLGTSEQMAHGVEKNISMTIDPASGANDDVWLWLSMPADQQVQDYYAATPWQMYFTG